jgi:hypothetical protein
MEGMTRPKKHLASTASPKKRSSGRRNQKRLTREKNSFSKGGTG